MPNQEHKGHDSKSYRLRDEVILLLWRMSVYHLVTQQCNEIYHEDLLGDPHHQSCDVMLPSLRENRHYQTVFRREMSCQVLASLLSLTMLLC